MQNAPGFPAPTDGKFLIGMVHLPPLPGSPGYRGTMQEVIQDALRDAAALEAAGFDALMIENFGDVPFYPDAVPPVTIAAMAAVAAKVRQTTHMPIGINVLRNDAAAALGIAVATGASFIRVNVHTGAMLTDQGWISGRAHDTLRLRAQLGGRVGICADVLVKHAIPPAGADLAEIARDTRLRGRADVLIVTGAATGAPTDPERVRIVKEALPETPVWIGSGVRPETIQALLEIADGAIVGSCLKRGGFAENPVDPGRASALIRAIGR
jgi:uncharacterized protein